MATANFKSKITSASSLKKFWVSVCVCVCVFGKRQQNQTKVEKWEEQPNLSGCDLNPKRKALDPRPYALDPRP